jgi:hypothetical protein
MLRLVWHDAVMVAGGPADGCELLSVMDANGWRDVNEECLSQGRSIVQCAMRTHCNPNPAIDDSISTTPLVYIR